MKTNKHTLLISLSLSLITCNILSAQTQEQLERQKSIFESLSKDPTTNIENFQTPKVSPPLTPDEDEKCFYTNNIDIDGITLISKNLVDKTLMNYIDKCNSISTLKNLTNEINALYIDKGYITSQAYLSLQNIADGNLTLQTVEGKINSITPKELNIEMASVSHRGNHLNIRDIEVLIENINRLPSNHATMKLVPSDEVGYSDIVIENTPTKRVGGSLGVDNFGGKKTGRAQISGKLNIDNLVGINDQINILYNTSNKHYGGENSVGSGYEFSFPYGRTTFTFSQKSNLFRQNIKAGADIFLSQGKTRTYTFDTNYKLYHDQINRVGIGASLSNYQTDNHFDNVYLETSSYRLSKLSLNSDYLYQIPGFYTFINLSYTRGVNLFNNHHSTALDDDYDILNISLSATKELYPFRYSLNAYAQHTNDLLFGSDRMSIGGPYSVRGFQAEGVSGNSGYYVRNELSYNRSYDLFNGVNNSLFLALDGGAIKPDESSFKGKLLGYSFGTKLQSNNLEASIHYSIPIYKKDISKSENFFGISLRATF